MGLLEIDTFPNIKGYHRTWDDLDLRHMHVDTSPSIKGYPNIP